MNVFKSFSAGLLAVIATSLFTSGVLAAPITTPVGLNPGDTYRLAFVTSTRRAANSSDIANYNDFVTAAANASALLAALGTSWTAIGSTATGDARDNTGTNPFTDGVGVTIYNLGGDAIAFGNADLWDPSTGAFGSIFLNEFGSSNGSARTVWTGTNRDGTASSATLGAASGRTMTGRVTSLSQFRWVENQTFQNGASFSLYGLSALLTVPEAIPEPATLALFVAGLAGLGLARLKRRN